MKNLLLGFLILGINLNAYANEMTAEINPSKFKKIIKEPIVMGDKGNGGDSCENRILNIRNDIKKWVFKGAGKKLNLGEIITPTKYRTEMLLAIKEAKISCTNNPVAYKKAKKTCINYVDEEDGSKRIRCNIGRFMGSNQSQQYKLIHHEYAGISGFEENEGSEESNYFISNQVIKFLKDFVTKRLILDSPKNEFHNFDEIREEFSKRYECGTDKSKSEGIECLYGARYADTKIILNLHLSAKKKPLFEVLQTSTTDLKIVKKFKKCIADNEYCILYMHTSFNEICELYYLKKGQASFTCLDEFNQLANKMGHFSLTNTNQLAMGFPERMGPELVPIELTSTGIKWSLFAPIDEDFGAEFFPKSEKGNLLRKKVTAMNTTPGIYKINYTSTLADQYIASRIDLHYRESGKINIDLESFVFGDQGYSSLYTIQGGLTKAICWTDSQDGDDSLNICFNDGGDIDYSFFEYD